MIAFAHLSDLHFGPNIRSDYPSWVPMQHPHHLAKCMALGMGLDRACLAMRWPLPGSELPVVVSGDLTVCGGEPELQLVRQFLQSSVPLGEEPDTAQDWGERCGLGRSGQQLATIPGNHDHWRGDRLAMHAYSGALYREHFEPTPWPRCFTSADGAITLQLFGIDSNSGWATDEATPTDRVLRRGSNRAQGRIGQAQFDSLNQLMQVRPHCSGTLVRALVCHHSPSHKGENWLGWLGERLATGELVASSRNQLQDLCKQHQVSAVLTGHAHDAHAEPLCAADAVPGDRIRCHELRSAHSVGFDRSFGVESNEVGFLVHRISKQDGDLRWDTWRMVWSGSGYEPEPSGEPFYSFTALAV